MVSIYVPEPVEIPFPLNWLVNALSVIYDYYQYVNFSFFYVPLFPVFVIWYLIDPSIWAPRVLRYFSRNTQFEAVMFTDITWDAFAWKIMLHYLWYPFLAERYTYEPVGEVEFVAYMFLRQFVDILAMLSGAISLTLFLPLEIAYLIVFTVGLFVPFEDYSYYSEGFCRLVDTCILPPGV